MSDAGLPRELNAISTRWAALNDPAQFVMRYAPAIRGYLLALLRDDHACDDVLGDFLMRVVEKGFPDADPDRGRFRDYLKTIIRNAALTFLRRQTTRRKHEAPLINEANLAEREAEHPWEGHWRECVLRAALRALEAQERKAPRSLCHTVVAHSLEHADQDSTAQARLLSARLGQEVNAAAYRKQLSRARHRFAELLILEIASGLPQPTPSLVEDELRDLGLLALVKEFLPPDWRTRGDLIPPSE